MISARTLLVLVPHDIPGAILSHSLPPHISEACVTLVWIFLPRLERALSFEGHDKFLAILEIGS